MTNRLKEHELNEVALEEAVRGAACSEGASSSNRNHRIALAVAAAIPASMYLVFVAHFARTGIYWDDWSFVPIVHNALNHNIDWSQLWQQHNENRELFPYLAVAGLGAVTHLNTRTIMYVDAALFIISFVLLLGTYRSYSGKQIAFWQTFLLGLVWFSIVDTQNALWAFQIAWYLVLLCMMALLFILGRKSVSKVGLAAAVVIAAIASFSSLQGLLLWPIGLLCLVWRLRGWRQLAVPLLVWVPVSVASFVAYFRGFSFADSTTGGGSTSFALHHLGQTGQYALALIGSVFPTTSSDPIVAEIIGGILLLLAVGVLVERGAILAVLHGSASACGPHLFALLFDITVAIGRASFGVVTVSNSSRYTMGNLLIVIALAVTVFAMPQAMPAHRRKQSTLSVAFVLGLGVVLLIGAQTAMSTDVGLITARAWDQRIEAGDTVLVQLHRIPQPKRTQLFNWFVFPSLHAATKWKWVEMAEQDRLGELARDPRPLTNTADCHPFPRGDRPRR